MARSRNSFGYFLGAGTTPPFRGFGASINPGAVHLRVRQARPRHHHPRRRHPKGTAAGNLTIGYYDTDAARTVTQNGTTTTYDLDVAGRRLTAATGPAGGAAISTLTRHYTDESDNPGWVANTTSGGTSITRYAGSLGGVNTTLTGTAVSLTLVDPHGDNVTTATVPVTGAATAIGAWSDQDEYGNPANPAAADAVGGATGYGWLGAHERGTDDTGLTLMGARLYNSVTGQFTSVDPVYGGNETPYNYPNDPINRADPTGLEDYHLTYNLGPLPTQIWVFTDILYASFSKYFGIKGAPKSLTRVGQRFSLDPVRDGLPGYFALTVGALKSDFFRFNTRFNHPDYPGFISFKFWKKNGELMFQIHGNVPFANLRFGPLGWWGYKKAAKKSWDRLAGNLRQITRSINACSRDPRCR